MDGYREKAWKVSKQPTIVHCPEFFRRISKRESKIGGIRPTLPDKPI